jgi:energy-coupling factor transport system permease protein
MKDVFSTYHPVVNMLYFILVIALAMIFMHPVCLLLSFLGAAAYAVCLKGRKALKFMVLFMLPTLVVAALVNPAFNHQGGTILTYLPSGNPLTLESMVYGLAAAVMLITVILWFSCYNAVMTADKFVYLFGRVIPALSLILSMTLRFVPRFQAQLRVISTAQKCMGRDLSQGSVLQRAKHGLGILSILVTWALENAIETAESMKGRGYGLPGRTAFSIYRFDRRDLGAVIFILAVGAYIIASSVTGGLYFRYFPTITGIGGGMRTVSLFAAYFALGIMPVALNVKEDFKWKAIASKI